MAAYPYTASAKGGLCCTGVSSSTCCLGSWRLWFCSLGRFGVLHVKLKQLMSMTLSLKIRCTASYTGQTCATPWPDCAQMHSHSPGGPLVPIGRPTHHSLSLHTNLHCMHVRVSSVWGVQLCAPQQGRFLCCAHADVPRRMRSSSMDCCLSTAHLGGAVLQALWGWAEPHTTRIT